MVTVYFDKQVFSHLFKAKDEKYIADAKYFFKCLFTTLQVFDT